MADNGYERNELNGQDTQPDQASKETSFGYFASASCMTALVTTATIAIGHSVLPGVGLSSWIKGAGSLHFATTSYLASAGILLGPALVLLFLADYIENPTARFAVQSLITAMFGIGALLLSPTIIGASSLSLFLQNAAGCLTLGVFFVGLVVALCLLGAVGCCISGCPEGDRSTHYSQTADYPKHDQSFHSGQSLFKDTDYAENEDGRRFDNSARI